MPDLSKIFPFFKKEEAIPEVPEVYKFGQQNIHELLIPPALEVDSNFVRIGELYVKTLFVIAYPRYLVSGWFSPIINMDQMVDVSIFYSSG